LLFTNPLPVGVHQNGHFQRKAAQIRTGMLFHGRAAVPIEGTIGDKLPCFQEELFFRQQRSSRPGLARAVLGPHCHRIMKDCAHRFAHQDVMPLSPVIDLIGKINVPTRSNCFYKLFRANEVSLLLIRPLSRA
jgi:hypothetical protein